MSEQASVAIPPVNELHLVESALDFLKRGHDPKSVIEMAVSGGKLIGFKRGSDIVLQTLTPKSVQWSRKPRRARPRMGL